MGQIPISVTEYPAELLNMPLPELGAMINASNIMIGKYGEVQPISEPVRYRDGYMMELARARSLEMKIERIFQEAKREQ